MDNTNDTKNTISRWHNFRLKIIAEGIIVGVFSSLFVIAYRLMLEKASALCKSIYLLQHRKTWLIPIWFLVLIILGYIVGRIIKREPMASGSGIPQVEGVLLGRLKMNWLRVLIAKFSGGVLCQFAGLSLGREGPSIQMGAAVGQGVSRVFKRIKLEEKYLITSGASAGLAAAFNAPFAGVIFALEEVHKNFSPIVMTSALAASITADFISKHFFGLKPMFNFKDIAPMPLSYYMYIVLLGIVLGVFGVIFNKVLLKTQSLYSKQRWLPVQAKPIVPFLMAGILGLVLPEVLGGGHEVVVSLFNGNAALKVLLIILIVKFIFTMISYGSSAPGGIFLPLLVLGALIGVIYGRVLTGIGLFNESYINNLIILGMAGYFSAIVRSPITGSILITEMTGSFTHLLSIGIVSLVAYVTAEIMNSMPVYEALLEKLLSKESGNVESSDEGKVIIEVPVCIGSAIEGKKIKDVKWPHQCLIVGIKRGGKEIIPKGQTEICHGDYLIVLTNEDKAAQIKKDFSEAAEKCMVIE